MKQLIIEGKHGTPSKMVTCSKIMQNRIYYPVVDMFKERKRQQKEGKKAQESSVRNLLDKAKQIKKQMENEEKE